jgi:alkylation response protein AidB-like acyl-CoA dehydrogenase
MDFAFSEEQEMLREQARNFMTSKFAPDRVVELAESDSPFDAASFKEMAELGWMGLSVPEESGGAGFGFLEEAVLFEELGKALYPGPFFSTVGLALPALVGDEEALGRVISGEAGATLAVAERGGARSLGDLEGLGTKAEGGNGSWTLTGEKILVPDLGSAEIVVVVAAAPDGAALFLVDRDDARHSVDSTVDSTRRFGELMLSGTPAKLLAEGDEARSLIERIRLRALAALALEAVGVGQACLDLALTHSKERKQFDKPIGTYQAVSHQVADTYVETELARSLAYWAAWCVAEADEQAPVATAAAKSAAAAAAVTAAEKSIQVHGGIGFTWEHILHRYYKRAQWIDAYEGSGSGQRKQIAASILDS